MLLPGCQLEANFDGRFSCSEPPYTCPDGLFCRLGQCVDKDGNPPPGGSPDAEVVIDPDGDVPSYDDPDAAGGIPDAGTPDAPIPRDAFQVTLGERNQATIRNVTFDTYVREDNVDANFGGNGLVIVDALPQFAGLLQFDLSSLQPDLHCLSAELIVSINDPIENGDYAIYAVSEPWNEGRATWNRRNSDNNWITPGAGPGSRASTPMARTAPRDLGDISIYLDPAVIEGWIRDPGSNHGMVWIADSPDGRGGSFRSSENSDSGTRPMLRLLLAP